MEENNVLIHPRLIVIGGSAGSLKAILEVLPGITPQLDAAIIIVVHRHHVYDSSLTELLAAKTTLLVKEAEEKEPLSPGTIFIVPADYHMLIESDFTISLDYSEKVNYSRPSIDVTLASAAAVYKRHMAALLLSGGNIDGKEGLEEVQAFGGIIAVQDPQSAEVDYMPRHALSALEVPHVLKNEDMAPFINDFASGKFGV